MKLDASLFNSFCALLFFLFRVDLLPFSLISIHSGVKSIPTREETVACGMCSPLTSYFQQVPSTAWLEAEFLNFR